MTPTQALLQLVVGQRNGTMGAMSNDQWNTGEDSQAWQTQPSADQHGQWTPPPGEAPASNPWQQPQHQGSAWDAPWQQPQQAPQDWNANPAGQWGAPPATQPSAQDWGAPFGGGQWPQAEQTSTSAQQPTSAQSYPPAGQQGAPEHPWQPATQAPTNEWQQQGQWQPASAPSGPKPVGFGTLFDFSMSRFAAGKAPGALYTGAAIALAVWWIFRLFTLLLSMPIRAALPSALADAGVVLFLLVFTRVLIELASTHVLRWERAEAEAEEQASTEATAPDPQAAGSSAAQAQAEAPTEPEGSAG